MTATTSTPLTGTRWKLDPEHSTAGFHVRTLWGLKTVHGRFRELDGTIESNGQMQLTLQADSVDTGNPRRDRHLGSADFFNAGRYPRVRFQSATVAYGDAGTLRVAGELAVAGRTARLELHPTIRRLGNDELELAVDTAIDQRVLGMTYHRFGIRAPAGVTVRARLHPVPEPSPEHATPAALSVQADA